MSDKALKNIFLNKFHRENGAKFVPFAGYDMPINYKTGIINEHLHVREKIGIFDVSHMGQILIPLNDKNALALETYIPLNIKKIQPNKSHYSFMLNKNGGIIDDIMISKINVNNQENIYIVYNASRKIILNEIFSNICENYSIIDNILSTMRSDDSVPESACNARIITTLTNIVASALVHDLCTFYSASRRDTEKKIYFNRLFSLSETLSTYQI